MAEEGSSALTWLALFTALFLVGSSISAGLAFYFVRNVDYKNGEASAMFAAIFSAGAFLLFLIYLARAHSAISSLQRAVGTRLVTVGQKLAPPLPAKT